MPQIVQRARFARTVSATPIRLSALFISFGSAVLSLLSWFPLMGASPLLFGPALILFGVSAIALIISFFAPSVSSLTVIPSDAPPEERYSPDAARVISHVPVPVWNNTQTSIPLSQLIQHLSKDRRFRFLLQRLMIVREIAKADDSFSLDQLLAAAWTNAKKRDSSHLDIGDLLIGLVAQPMLAQWLADQGIRGEDLESLLTWEADDADRLVEERRWWSRERLLGLKSIGYEWAFGYTVKLDELSRDLTRRFSSSAARDIHLLAHSAELNKIEDALVRKIQHNVLIVADSGVGIPIVLDALAAAMALGTSRRHLRYKRLVSLDINRLLTGTSSPTEVLDRLERILYEASHAGNVILVLPDIDRLLASQPGAGQIEAAGVVLQFLRSPLITVIGTISTDGFHRAIESNQSIRDEMEVVTLHEPDVAETLLIVQEVAIPLENKTKRFISYSAIKRAVEAADRFIHDQPFPEKAVGLLDEATSRAISLDAKIIGKEHVDMVITSRTAIPVGELDATEKQRLLHLEELLHTRVLGQDEAIVALANALRRARSGAGSIKRPIGTFLFLGPTGVGKTETAKALAEIYFGSEERMLRFDMTEFQTEDALARLIGSPFSVGTSQGGVFSTAVRAQPFSLILLDELEKAHRDVINLLLGALDEGQIKDAQGKIVDFRNTIIIATSNAGAELIRNAIRDGKESTSLKQQLLDHLIANRIFTPEFINRFDGVISFSPLSQELLVQVAHLLLTQLANRVSKEREITLTFASGVAEILAERGYDPAFGARPLRRVIQDSIENVLARDILSGMVRPGGTLEITVADLG